MNTPLSHELGYNNISENDKSLLGKNAVSDVVIGSTNQHLAAGHISLTNIVEQPPLLDR